MTAFFELLSDQVSALYPDANCTGRNSQLPVMSS